MESLIIIVLRLLLPLTIFRFPLAGVVASMLLDAFDVTILDAFGARIGGADFFWHNYDSLDKWLDMYYLSIAFYMSLKWQFKLAKNTSIALFVYRAVGVILFEVTQIRVLLFIFPNMFENFYIFYLTAKRFFPSMVPKNIRELGFWLLVLYIPKFVQEYSLHVAGGGLRGFVIPQIRELGEFLRFR